VTEPQRLSKRVAQLRACSRREAELFIEGGWVKVDGRIVDVPQFHVQDEVIEIDPAASAQPQQPVTMLLHKLAGGAEALDPALQWSEDSSGIRPLKKHFSHLVSPAPLPPGASGLLVLSQDGRVLRKLTEDEMTMEQELIVQVAGEATSELLQRLQQGLTLGRPLAAVKASVNSQTDSETRLRFAIKGVGCAQVPAMCESNGLRVLAVKRMRIGRVALGPVPPGQWRYLLAHERF
jgi:23S rRNA pseudouridine2604 synthase